MSCILLKRLLGWILLRVDDSISELIYFEVGSGGLEGEVAGGIGVMYGGSRMAIYREGEGEFFFLR